MDSFKIEQADEMLIEKLAKEIWTEHYISILSKEQIDYMLEKYQSAKAVREQIKNGYSYFVMYLNGVISGYTGIVFEKDKMFLSKLYVKKQARKKHIAKNTLDYLKKLCREKGYNKIYLTVNKNNSDSVKAYKNMGFYELDSTVTDIGNGFVMDDYIMELCF